MWPDAVDRTEIVVVVVEAVTRVGDGLAAQSAYGVLWDTVLSGHTGYLLCVKAVARSRGRRPSFSLSAGALRFDVSENRLSGLDNQSLVYEHA